MSLDISETMKGISVIIPAFNRAKLLKEAIISITEQDYQGSVEILISDDGSTDEVSKVASSFGPQVKFIEKPKDSIHKGASYARNRGILAATKPYICFLDSDDFYLPGHLTRMVAAIESGPDFGFALCNSLKMIDIEHDNRFKRWTKLNVEPRDISNLAISTTNFANTNGFIFKREVFQKIGLFNEKLKNAEDTDMWIRISEKFKGVHANHYGTVIRLHSDARLTDVPKHVLLENHYEVFSNALKRYYKDGMEDSYRLQRLYSLCLKYKVSQWPIFNKAFKTISIRNMKREAYTAEDYSWKPLESFIE
ncbi:glycosyltransferase family 2 protein [Christiangramia sp. LLG6405-1]|uniref:glycosyltransferase family 2 protein n=1 Tax=Christiangramia sp. LLG6405-1 TaxID=3160832 RepID=UPI003867E197